MPHNRALIPVVSYCLREVIPPKSHTVQQTSSASVRRSRPLSRATQFSLEFLPRFQRPSAVFTTGFNGYHLHPSTRAAPSSRSPHPISSAWLRGSAEKRHGLFNIRLVWTRCVKRSNESARRTAQRFAGYHASALCTSTAE